MMYNVQGLQRMYIVHQDNSSGMINMNNGTLAAQYQKRGREESENNKQHFRFIQRWMYLSLYSPSLSYSPCIFLYIFCSPCIVLVHPLQSLYIFVIFVIKSLYILVHLLQSLYSPCTSLSSLSYSPGVIICDRLYLHIIRNSTFE